MSKNLLDSHLVLSIASHLNEQTLPAMRTEVGYPHNVLWLEV